MSPHWSRAPPEKNLGPTAGDGAGSPAGNAAADRAGLSPGMSELPELRPLSNGVGGACTHCTSALTEYYYRSLRREVNFQPSGKPAWAKKDLTRSGH
jgi:hypothetical protein